MIQKFHLLASTTTAASTSGAATTTQEKIETTAAKLASTAAITVVAGAATTITIEDGTSLAEGTTPGKNIPILFYLQGTGVQNGNFVSVPNFSKSTSNKVESKLNLIF